MSSKYYTGVGSRETPISVLEEMKFIAKFLETKGFILRTGDAFGADKAFRDGATNKRVYDVSHSCDKSMDMASKIHPNWLACSDYAKKLHARNCKQVLGDNLADPSQFLICWTKNGKPQGGTRTAIILANNNGVKVYNLALKSDRSQLKELLKSI